MKNINHIARGIWNVLKEPADDCGIFPIYARVAVYGILLLTLLIVQSSSFDYGELLTVVGFTSIVTVIESMWKKTGAGRKLIWHFSALIVLIFFLGIVLNEAAHVRGAWYRTHVLEERIETLISTAPTAIIVADGAGKIKYINKNTTNLIEWENEELIGKPLTVLMRPQKIKAHLEAFNKSVKELERGSAQWIYTGNHVFRIVTKNSKIIKVRIYIMGMRFSSDLEKGKYPNGKDIEFYGIIIPIEPLLEPEEAAEEAVKKIDASKKEEKRDRNDTKKELK